MTTLIDPHGRRPAPGWRVDLPLEPVLLLEPFADAWLETFRRGVAQESREAVALVRQFGLEMPCGRQTT